MEEEQEIKEEKTEAAESEENADKPDSKGDEKKEELSPVEEGETILEFDVKMSSDILYDYLLRHSYSSAVGLIGSCFGAFGIIMFAMSGGWLYLIMGIIVLVYLPVTLFKRSKMVMLTNPALNSRCITAFTKKALP